MSIERSKKKTALIILGCFIGLILFFTLLILIRDFIPIIVVAITFSTVIGLTAWGLWDELWPEIHARDKMIAELYELAVTEEQKKWTKFFIEYFDL